MDNIGYFKLSNAKEAALWERAVIVLDTSTLGNLYCMAEEPKKTLVDIFGIVKDKIWLPGQVMYEYKKNRDKLVENSFSAYDLPKEGVYVNRYEQEMNAFLSKNESDNYHPYIEEDPLKRIREADTIIREKLKVIKKEIKDQYAKRKDSLRKEIGSDVVNALVENLPHGEPFTFEQQMAIVHDGELRYRNLIPPGYEDAPPFNHKKKGLQRYGDLIVWKEILRYAKEQGRPVIFVCNDLKNDWYYFDDKKPTAIPRHELIKEFEDETGQLFWMYSLKDFIQKLEVRYKDSTYLPLFPKLEIVKRVLIQNENKQRRRNYRHPDDLLVVKCDACCEEEDMDGNGLVFIRKDEIDWDWEGEYSDEREMGVEYEYEHQETVECGNGHEITITFRLWEYPRGVVNHTEIECDGGEIEQEFGFEDTIDLTDGDEEGICARCGQVGFVDERGLCVDCYREYNDFCDEDD